MKPIAIALLVCVCASSSTLAAQIHGGWWVAQGPGPATGGQAENVSPGNEVVGAVQALVRTDDPAAVETLERAAGMAEALLGPDHRFTVEAMSRRKLAEL